MYLGYMGSFGVKRLQKFICIIYFLFCVEAIKIKVIFKFGNMTWSEWVQSE